MTTIQVHLTHLQLEHILVQELTTSRDRLLRMLQDRRENRVAVGMFDTDRASDIQMLKMHIDAANMMLNYHTPHDQHDTIVTYLADDRDTADGEGVR
jgi:hypothetical protein